MECLFEHFQPAGRACRHRHKTGWSTLALAAECRRARSGDDGAGSDRSSWRQSSSPNASPAEGGPLVAQRLKGVSPADVGRIFGGARILSPVGIRLHRRLPHPWGMVEAS